MLSKTQTINVNGRSTVETEGKEVLVMTMNATIGEYGSVNISKNIQDKSLYLKNKVAVDVDAAEFEEYVNRMLED